MNRAISQPQPISSSSATAWIYTSTRVSYKRRSVSFSERRSRT